MSAPAPGTPEWMGIVTASKVAAILGLSPWESPRSMWHSMRGELPPVEESEPMRRGNKLENAILDWFLDDHASDLTEAGRQVFHTLAPWCGSTPDMVVVNAEDEWELVDAKTAATDEDWGTPGTDQAPAYYVASSMWQMAMCPEAKRVRLAVLFGRPFALREYVIERDDDLIEQIVGHCQRFHTSLSSDVTPDLDDSVATYDAVRAIHPDIDRDAEVHLTEAERDEYLSSKRDAAVAAARERAAKTVVLDRMGNARLAKCNGQTIARRQPSRYGVSLVAVASIIPTDMQESA